MQRDKIFRKLCLNKIYANKLSGNKFFIIWTKCYIGNRLNMGRTFAAVPKMAFLAVFVIVTLALIQPASATSQTITLSGHINYQGPNDVFFSPEGANVTARYMGQTYFTTADSHGDYMIGPIDFGQDYTFEFRINYTDATGNYYVWPANDWHSTLLPADGKVVQDMILIKSTTPAPTAVPTATPSPTPVITHRHRHRRRYRQSALRRLQGILQRRRPPLCRQRRLRQQRRHPYCSKRCRDHGGPHADWLHNKEKAISRGSCPVLFLINSFIARPFLVSGNEPA